MRGCVCGGGEDGGGGVGVSVDVKGGDARGARRRRGGRE